MSQHQNPEAMHLPAAALCHRSARGWIVAGLLVVVGGAGPSACKPAQAPAAEASASAEPLPTGTWAELSARFLAEDCPSYLRDARGRMVRARTDWAPEAELRQAAALWLQACERDRRRIAAAPAEVASLDVAGLEARYLERGPGTPDQLRERIELWRQEAGDDVTGYRSFLLLQVVAAGR